MLGDENSELWGFILDFKSLPGVVFTCFKSSFIEGNSYCNFLYRILFGSMFPSRFSLSSSYSEKLPS